METTSKPPRAFTEKHLKALKQGAKRRKEEQIVGNRIRITNPILFAKLLMEVLTPSSEALGDAFGAVQPRTSAVPTREVEASNPHRKPPPMMNII